jgi:cold shock CspA family protein
MKEFTMKYFGTVKSFDSALGYGELRQDLGGDALRFEESAISWGKDAPPTVGQRLSYERGRNDQLQPRAFNLQAV